MAEEEQDISPIKKKGNFFVRLGKFFIRLGIYILAFFIISSVLLMTLAQNENFLNWSKDLMLKVINSNLEGSISFSRIKLTGLHGINIYDLKIMAAGDTVLSAKEASLDFEFYALFDSKAIIHSFIVESPNIKLIRSAADSTWNIDHIAKPPKEPSKGPPNWIVSIKKLSIVNASFRMYDSVAVLSRMNDTSGNIRVMPVAGRLDFSDLRLQGLNLDLSAALALKKNNYQAEIYKLSFAETKSKLALKDFSAKITLEPNHIEAVSLKVKTGGSEFGADLKLDSVNLFGKPEEADISRGNFRVLLNAEEIDPSEIEKIADLPVKLSNKFGINLETSGNLDKINIESLDISFGSSFVSLNGRLNNITKPEKIAYKINLRPTNIISKDIRYLLPKELLASIPDFGSIEFNNTTIEGTADSISTNIELSSGLGKVKGKAGIGLSGKQPSYTGSLEIANLDLTKVAGKQGVNGSFNGTIDISGSGSKLSDLNTIINLQSENSIINDIGYSRADISCKISDRGMIKVDTLRLTLTRAEENNPGFIDAGMKRTLFAHGWINLENQAKPAYDLSLSFNALNLAGILKNKSAPSMLTGEISVTAEGFDPDSLKGKMTARFDECVFGDRALFPFGLNLQIGREGNSFRSLKLNSDLMNIEIAGNYTYPGLIDQIQKQGEFIGNWFAHKFRSLNQDTTSGSNQYKYNNSPISGNASDFTLKAEINDISPLSVFLNDLKLSFKAGIGIRMSTKDGASHLLLDSTNVREFNLELPGLVINSNPILIKGGFDLEDNGAAVDISNLNLSLSGVNVSRINDLIISTPYTKVNFRKGNAELTASTTLNNDIRIASSGTVEFGEDNISVRMDTTTFSYLKAFTWKSSKPLEAEYSPSGINVRSFAFERKGAENLTLDGKYNNGRAEQIRLKILHYPLMEVSQLLSKDNSGLKQISGIIDTASIVLDGEISNPVIRMSLYGNDIKLNDAYLGNVQSQLSHKDSLVTGFIDFKNLALGNIGEKIDVEVKSLPLNLSFTTKGSRFHSANPLDVRLISDKFPLKLVEPYAPGLSELKGYATVKINVFGTAPDNIDYSGNFSFSNALARVEATNLQYYANANIDLVKDKVIIKNATVYNSPEDDARGKAVVTGSVSLKNLDITYVDIKIASNRLMVLSPATIKTMPNLYGNLFIATGNNPLHFYGSLKEPNLDGDLNVLGGDIKMPELSSSTQTQTVLKYEVINKHIYVYDSTLLKRDSLVKAQFASKDSISREVTSPSAKPFPDLINYDLYIKILSPVYLTMNILGSQLNSQIATSDRTQPIHYVKIREKDLPDLYGDLVLQEGSTLKFYKVFKTKGSLIFSTGSIGNPNLNLEADFTGKGNNDEIRSYTVKLFITGTKEQPKLNMSYSINGEEATGDTAKISENALLLLLFGKTKENLAGGSIQNNLVNQTVTSLLSSEASKAFTQLLGGTGVIQNAELDIGNGTWADTRVKLTGQLLGDAVRWEIGGTVADFAGNNEISINVPLADILNTELLNFNVQFTKSTNLSTTTSLDQKEWEVKFNLGGSW